MGFLCIDWAVIRNQRTAAPALKIGKTAAIATAVGLIAVFPAYGLVKNFEDFPVEARTTATVCQRAESVTVCVWPENAKNLSVFVSAANKIHDQYQKAHKKLPYSIVSESSKDHTPWQFVATDENAGNESLAVTALLNSLRNAQESNQ